MNQGETERIKQIKRSREHEWLALEGVVAVGIGAVASGAMGLVVSVKGDAERVRTAIPESVDGIDVEIRVTGELRAL